MNCAEKLLEPTIFFNFIHQVTIELRFRKSLAQEIFYSNLSVIVLCFVVRYFMSILVLQSS